VPPGVGRELAARRLLGADQARRHVRDAVHGVGVEEVGVGVLHVDEDVVVLGGPAAPRPRAIVVGPHDLVEEARAPEDRVAEDLGVVHLAVVEVQIEATGPLEDAVRLDEPRLEKGEVVVEHVGERARPQLEGPVPVSAEAHPIARGIAHRTELRACLAAPRVEGGVDVDEVDGLAGNVGEDGEIVPPDDEAEPTGRLWLAIHEARPTGEGRLGHGGSVRAYSPILRPPRYASKPQ